MIMSQQNQENCTDGDENKENDSSIEGEDDDRFDFSRSIPDDAPTLKNGMSEAEKRVLDVAAAINEIERFISNRIER